MTGLRENLAALASLDYPDYELIVVAHSAADIPGGVLPSKARIVLAHGNDPTTGEKVQNLQAAVRATRKRSQILAFADSDGRVSRHWLRALVAPLSEPNVGASTGYRWFAPEPPTFLDAAAECVGRRRFRPAGSGRQQLRLGRRHGDPQGDLLRSARLRALEEHGQRRLRAECRGARRRADHRLRSRRADPLPGIDHRPPVLLLDPPADGDHAGLQCPPVVARADRAYLLLRRHGGLDSGIRPRQPPGGVGADCAAFARHAEGPQSRDIGEGGAATMRGTGSAGTSGSTPSGCRLRRGSG